MTEKPAQARERRVLLVEFVSHERWVYNSRYFPFIQGAVRELGGQARWLCFGAEVRVVKTERRRVEQYVELDEADRATLAWHVESLRPTHVVISHPVSDAVRAVLRGGGTDVAVLSTSDHTPAPGEDNVWTYVGSLFQKRQAHAATRLGRTPAHPLLQDDPVSWLQGRTDWLLGWLGESPDGSSAFDRYIVGTFEPFYDAVMANAKAKAFRPHLLILGGVACDHFRKVQAHPAYAGLDLSDCTHDYGCSYCTWFRGATSDLHRNPMVVAEAQLRRVLETAGQGGRYCGVVDLLDVRIFSQVDRFVDRVIGMGLPPTKLCFEPRVDRVRQLAPKLDRALEACRRGGHSICLFRMGIENMVEEENRLFNKHVTLSQVDEGVRLLESIAARHGDAFEYDPCWGYITCTPWTTLEMLETGFSRAAERGFEPKGVWLYTPLLLFRSAPITRLAESQGLVTEAFPDLSMLYEPSVNDASIDSFVPWRFRDERTAAAFALIVRFCAAALRDKYPDNVFDGDELYGRLLAQESPDDLFARPDLFARAAIAAVREASGAYEPGPQPSDAAAAQPAQGERTLRLPLGELLDRALAGYRGVLGALAPSERRQGVEGAPPPARAAFARKVRRVLEAVRMRLARHLGELRVVDVAPGHGDGELILRLETGGRPVELRVRAAAADVPAFIRTPHFCATYSQDTPVREGSEQRELKTLLEGFDLALTRHAPELLPGASTR